MARTHGRVKLRVNRSDKLRRSEDRWAAEVLCIISEFTPRSGCSSMVELRLPIFRCGFDSRRPLHSPQGQQLEFLKKCGSWAPRLEASVLPLNYTRSVG